VRHKLEEPKIFRSQSTGLSQIQTLHRLMTDQATIRATLGMIILCTVQNFAYYGFMIWLPTYLSHDLGYSLTRSSMWTACAVAGMIAGALTFGAAADKMGRRPAFLLYQACACVALFFYSGLREPFALLLAGAVVGFFVNGMIGGYGALLAELYPTQARAVAENVIFNTGRGLGGFGPIIIGTLASRFSFETALTLLCALYLIDMLAIIFLIPEKRGFPLD
jgi:MFS family permease